jgi:hypothetical protein
MRKLNKILKSKGGEGYIDVVVGVLISTMLLVLIINVFSFLTVKQDMDYFAKEMIFVATAYGKTTDEVNSRYTELVTETGLNPTISWQTTYFDSFDETVQYGDTITVTITYHTFLKGFGVFQIPVTLTAKHSGLSQMYWK